MTARAVGSGAVDSCVSLAVTRIAIANTPTAATAAPAMSHRLRSIGFVAPQSSGVRIAVR